MQNRGIVLGIILIVVLVLLILGGAGMMGFGGYGGMMNGYGGMMGGYGAQGFGTNPIGAILSLVFWALVIAGVVLLVIWLVRSSGRTASSDTAMDILKTRYAKGEITKEQFDLMKIDLGR